MPRERVEDKRHRALEILQRLSKSYPDSTISLDFGNEFQLLVAVILSAQCTDARVNIVTRELFRKYRTVDDFADADPRVFEKEIFSTGFYRNKTRNIIGAAKTVREEFGGHVPHTMEELLRLPGVARKTANVVLHHAFGAAQGIAVDTHVTRLSNLLRLTRQKDPKRIEQDLVRLLPKQQWGDVTHYLIDHGRAVCVANRPRCEMCVVNDLCPSALRPQDHNLMRPKTARTR